MCCVAHQVAWDHNIVLLQPWLHRAVLQHNHETVLLQPGSEPSAVKMIAAYV